MMGSETELLCPRTSEAGPATFHRVSSAQRNLPAVSGEHMHSSFGRHQPIKNYESMLKGVASIKFGVKYEKIPNAHALFRNALRCSIAESFEMLGDAMR